MSQNYITGWMYLSCLLGNLFILPVLSYPSVEDQYSQQQPQPPHIVLPEGRKFTQEKQYSPIKSNSLQPESRNSLEDVQMDTVPLRKNVQDNGGFSWANMATTILQMLFNQPANLGPSKSDNSIDGGQNLSQSPWTNVFSVGLKLLSVFLGGGQGVGGDGIDKIDNASPYQGLLNVVLSTFMGARNDDQVVKISEQTGQFIGTIMQLMETLKQSFSHRSSSARSLGRRDAVSEGAVAGINFFKGYLRSMKTNGDDCTERIICEANKECAQDLNDPNAIFCQMGAYATSTLMLKTSSVPYESMREAGRRGRNARSLDDCKQIYDTCNEKY